MSMGYLESIFYSDNGPDIGRGYPAIIFLHGFFMDSRMFEKQLPDLQLKYRVICMDIRGFGRSKSNNKSFSLYDLVNDVIKLADHLKIKQFIICGMSMGGYIALRACIRVPKRIIGLILIGTQIGQDNKETVSKYVYIRDNWNKIDIRKKTIDQLLPIIVGENLTDTSFWRNVWMSHSYEGIYNSMNAMLKRDDIKEKVKRINIPTLILHGEDDCGIPVNAAVELAETLKYSRLIKIPSGNHAVNITHPKLTNNAILNWLQDYF